jgi:hypothetical protein
VLFPKMSVGNWKKRLFPFCDKQKAGFKSKSINKNKLKKINYDDRENPSEKLIKTPKKPKIKTAKDFKELLETYKKRSEIWRSKISAKK